MALDDVMVCYGQNGEMLRPEQGYPLRLVVPGVQGVSSVKWLRRIKDGDQPWNTREESLHYVDLMPGGIHRRYTWIQEAKSVITSPSGGQVLLEVYALTAYVLNLNDIVPADAVLDQDSLPKLTMPNRDGFATAHGFMERNGRPDTRNTACMVECAKDVRLSSEMPDYARDQHGNLAEQIRAIGAVPPLPAAAAPKSGLGLAKDSACTACHGVSERLVGPGFREVASRYAGDAAAQSRLVAKVRSGGAGAWGPVPMPPQPKVRDADAKALVQWILGGAK